MTALPAIAQDILDFWFLPEQDAGHGEPRKAWFVKSDDFDQEIRNRFGAEVDGALDGEYGHWTETAKGTLALLLLLDQFTRNIYRGQPKAFDGDERGLAVAREALKKGFDVEMPPVARPFFYLPYEHCEDIEVCRSIGPKFQDVSALAGNSEVYDYWLAHMEVLEKFGRYPHRNAILGRDSTAEEAAYLAQPGSGF